MTLGNLLRTHAERAPLATALLCGDRIVSFVELDASTDHLAAWLLAHGLRPGDRVAVQWPNAPEVVQIFFAAFKAGLIAVPINLRLKPSEIGWVLQNSGAALCFAHPALAESARQTGARVLTELLELAADVDATLPDIAEDAPALILYTSGSTGRPKGAVLTHRNLLATGELCARVVEEGCGGEVKARGLLMTPLMHSSGLFVLLSSLQRGEPCIL